MKAVLRCMVSQIRTICYMSTRGSLFSAGSRVALLERNVGHNVVFENMYSTIYHSPFGHQSRTCTYVQKIVDVRSLPQDRAETQKSVYNALFDDAHPRITLLNRFDAAYRSRWCKPGCLNNPKLRVLSKRAIR